MTTINDDSFYAVEGEKLKLVESVMRRLHSEERMSGDDMRDAGHLLYAFLDEVFELDRYQDLLDHRPRKGTVVKHVHKWNRPDADDDETEHGTICGVPYEPGNVASAQHSMLRGNDICPDCATKGIALYKKVAPHFASALRDSQVKVNS